MRTLILFLAITASAHADYTINIPDNYRVNINQQQDEYQQQLERQHQMDMEDMLREQRQMQRDMARQKLYDDIEWVNNGRYR